MPTLIPLGHEADASDTAQWTEGPAAANNGSIPIGTAEADAEWNKRRWGGTKLLD
jgi:hypothetical protein